MKKARPSPKPIVHPLAAVAPGYLANHASRVFNRRVDDALRPHGLSLALIAPVLMLSWKGPMLQVDLVRLSAIKQPAMVALLDKLEGLGLVMRTPCPDDRRAATVALTAAGEIAATRGGDALVAANAIAMNGFSDDEARLVVSMLQRIIDNLEGAGKIHHD